MIRKYLLLIIVVLLLITNIYLVGFNNRIQDKTVYIDVKESIEKIFNLKEILYIQVFKNDILVLLEDNLGISGAFLKDVNGELQVNSTFGTAALSSDEGITWAASGTKDNHIFYGLITNPKIEQVVIKSENYKTARIIKTESGKKIWYSLQKEQFNFPMRIYGLSLQGEELYKRDYKSDSLFE